jgi:hypothetical protein
LVAAVALYFCYQVALYLELLLEVAVVFIYSDVHLLAEDRQLGLFLDLLHLFGAYVLHRPWSGAGFRLFYFAPHAFDLFGEFLDGRVELHYSAPVAGDDTILLPSFLLLSMRLTTFAVAGVVVSLLFPGH